MIKDCNIRGNERKHQQKVFSPRKNPTKGHPIRVQSEQTVHIGQWYGFKTVTCSVGNSTYHKYEAAFRTKKEANIHIDGVDVVPIIQYSHKKPELVIIANYRPPVGKFCLQFPAGLADTNNYEEEAKRQTEQETGYKVKSFAEIPMPTMYSDPWRSSESIVMYIAKIDGDDTRRNVGQNLEEDENIRVYRVPFDRNLLKSINELAQKHDYAIEKNVWAVALGLVLKETVK